MFMCPDYEFFNDTITGLLDRYINNLVYVTINTI